MKHFEIHKNEAYGIYIKSIVSIYLISEEVGI